MSKWADFLITGSRKRDDETISHVYIHEHTDNGFSPTGKLVSETDVFRLMSQNKTFITARWDYAGHMHKGAKVIQKKNIHGTVYLTTVPDATEKDNLLNLFPI